jgi:hypothetical protein
VTANCLSEKIVPRISAYPDEALYIKNKVSTIRKGVLQYVDR